MLLMLDTAIPAGVPLIVFVLLIWPLLLFFLGAIVTFALHYVLIPLIAPLFIRRNAD